MSQMMSEKEIDEIYLQPALDNLRSGLGSSFSLSDSELCAARGACNTQGLGAGSPLVCQSQSGRLLNFIV